MPFTSDTPTIPGPSLTFDKDGDIILKVGTNPSEKMLVDSHVLCRSSPVFRKLLRGPFAERKPEHGNWSIRLPGDDKESFAILMDMAHGLYSRVNEEITVEKLYRLCVLTDKYGMVSVLRPMQYRWFERIEANIRLFAYQDELHQKAMFISFELGYSDTLKRWIFNLMQRCSTNVNGEFIDKYDVPLMQHKTFTTPHMCNILKHATEFRRKCLAHYKTTCHDFTTRALNGSTVWDISIIPSSCSSCNNCSCRGGQNISASIGKMLNKAYKLDIMGFFLPLAVEPDMTVCLSSLCRKLGEVENETRCGHGCVFTGALMETLGKFECAVLTAEEEAYIRGQAAKVRML